MPAGNRGRKGRVLAAQGVRRKQCATRCRYLLSAVDFWRQEKSRTGVGAGSAEAMKLEALARIMRQTLQATFDDPIPARRHAQRIGDELL